MRYSIFLKENHEIFVQMLDKINAEIMIMDDRYKVILINHAMCRRMGVLRKDIEGVEIEELVKAGSIITSSMITAMYGNEEKCMISNGKSEEYRMISCFPLFYQGEVDLVVYINKDISRIEKSGMLLKRDNIVQIDKYKRKLRKKNSQNELAEISVYDTSLGLDGMMERYEKQILLQTLEECGTMTAAALKLKVNKSTVSRKVRKHDIKP